VHAVATSEQTLGPDHEGMTVLLENYAALPRQTQRDTRLRHAGTGQCHTSPLCPVGLVAKARRRMGGHSCCCPALPLAIADFCIRDIATISGVIAHCRKENRPFPARMVWVTIRIVVSDPLQPNPPPSCDVYPNRSLLCYAVLRAAPAGGVGERIPVPAQNAVYASSPPYWHRMFKLPVSEEHDHATRLYKRSGRILNQPG
jgi:hypothetical protein